jgi:hypothetical protein
MRWSDIRFMNNSLFADLQKKSGLAVASLVLAAFMCTVPFLRFNQHDLIPTFKAEVFSVTLGLLALVLLLRPIAWRPFYFPSIALLPIGLMLVLVLQVGLGLMSYWQQHAVIALCLLWVLLMMFLATQLRREFSLTTMIPVLAWSIFIAGVVLAVITVTRPISVSLGFIEASSQSTLIASYLALSLASLFFLLHSKRVTSSVAMIIGTLLLLALVVTHQNLSWVYIAILSIAIWLSIKDKRTLFWQPIWMIAVFVIWQLLVPQISIHGDFVFAKPIHSPSLSIYWQYLHEAWLVFLNHPLLGAGWGQFGWQDLLFAEAFPLNTGWAKHPHNLLLQLLAETGLIGTSIFIGCLVPFLRKAFKGNISEEYWWLYTVLSLLGVYAMFDNAFSNVHVLALFALMLGLIETRIYKLQLALGHVIAALVITFATFALYQLNAQYSKLQYWYAQNDFERITENQARPMLLQMGELRHQSLLTPYIDRAIVHTLQSKPAFINKKLSLNTILVHHSPSPQEVYNQVELLALSGKTSEAKHLLLLALIRHPNDRYDFTMHLLNNQTKETLPLAPLIARYNLQSTAVQKYKKNPN